MSFLNWSSFWRHHSPVSYQEVIWCDSGYPVHNSLMMETEMNFSFLECYGYSLVHDYQLSGGICPICLNNGRVKRSLNLESAGNISAFLPDCMVLYRKVLSVSFIHLLTVVRTSSIAQRQIWSPTHWEWCTYSKIVSLVVAMEALNPNNKLCKSVLSQSVVITDITVWRPSAVSYLCNITYCHLLLQSSCCIRQYSVFIWSSWNGSKHKQVGCWRHCCTSQASLP